MPEVKICSQCKLELDLSEFSKRASGYVFARCKVCCNSAVRITKQCDFCGNKFPATSKSIKKFCSEKCRTEAAKNRAQSDHRITLRYNVFDRAKRENIEADFKKEDISIPVLCPVTNIDIAIDKSAPLADSNPVIDRIDLSRSYEKGNLIVVSMKAFKERVIGSSKCSHCGKAIDTQRVHAARGAQSERFCDAKCNRDFYNKKNSGISGGANTDRYDPALIPTSPITRQLAAEQALPFYFSGNPCRRGHIVARRVSNGNCLECEKENRPAKTKEQNERYHANKTDINKRRNEALQADPKRRAIANLRSYRSVLFRRLIDERREGLFRDSLDEDLGCTHEDFFIHIESTFTDGMTWENYGEWHLDHVKPVSLFENPLCAEAWNWRNYQALWAEDNIRKGGANNPDLKALYGNTQGFSE